MDKEKEEKLLREFALEIEDKKSNILDLDESLSRTVCTILAAHVCKMVVERYGKTELSHSLLNDTMCDAWKAVAIVGDINVENKR